VRVHRYCAGVGSARRGGTGTRHKNRQTDRLFWRACRSNPKSVKTSNDPVEMLRADLENERETVGRYRERIRQAEAMGEFALSETLRAIIVQEQDTRSIWRRRWISTCPLRKSRRAGHLARTSEEHKNPGRPVDMKDFPKSNPVHHTQKSKFGCAGSSIICAGCREDQEPKARRYSRLPPKCSPAW